jgi:hypothetical protein
VAFKFTPVINNADLTPEPRILVSTQGITLVHPSVLKSLGNPEYVLLEIDVDSNALRLTKTDGATLGAKRVRPPLKNGRSPFITSLALSNLRSGVYKPLGGGVFIFDKPKGSTKNK